MDKYATEIGLLAISFIGVVFTTLTSVLIGRFFKRADHYKSERELIDKNQDEKILENEKIAHKALETAMANKVEIKENKELFKQVQSEIGADIKHNNEIVLDISVSMKTQNEINNALKESMSQLAETQNLILKKLL